MCVTMYIKDICYNVKDVCHDVCSDALLLKQIPKKQTGFVLVLNQNKPGLFF